MIETNTDDLERQMNLEVLDIAERQADTADTFVDVNMVYVLLGRFAELEIARLEAKARMLARSVSE